MTRVVKRALDVSFGTAAHVPAEIGGTAVGDPVCRPMHVRREPVPYGVTLEMRLEDLPQRAFHATGTRAPRQRLYDLWPLHSLPRRSRARAT